MRKSIRPHSLLAVICLSLAAAAGLLAYDAGPAPAATTWLPPALYAGGDLTLSGTAKITSPLAGGQPTAGLYVKGRLINAGTGSLKTVKQYLGTAAPAFSQFMPQSRIDQIVLAAQDAKQEGTVYGGLTITGTKDQTFTGPITVNGDLTITGSGKYTFASVYVTGNVIVNNAKTQVTYASLRVEGSLTVSAGALKQAGPTFVAGTTSLTGSGTWAMRLLVTTGDLIVAGSQSIGSASAPVTMLLTGQGRALTYTCTGTCYGLLCNTSGGFVEQTSTGKVVGSVLCTASCTMSSSASVAYDPIVGKVVLDVAGPSVSISSPLDGSVLDTRSPLLQYAVTEEQGGSGVDPSRTTVTLDGAPTTWANGGTPPRPLGDGPHTVVVTAYDRAGNKGSAASTFTVQMDSTPPTTVASVSPLPSASGWHTSDVTVTFDATDGEGGSGVAATRYTIDGGAAQDYSAPFALTEEGTHAVSYWSTDKAGNAESPEPLTVSIDKTMPTMSVAGHPDGWSQDPVTLLFAPVVGPSGASVVECRVDSGAWETLLAPVGVYQLTLSVEGQHTVDFRVTNGAGVMSAEGSCSFGIDTTPPIVTLQSLANGSTTGYNMPALLFTQEDGDIGSGFDPQQSAAEITFDGRSFSAGSGYLFPTKLSDGVHTLLVTVADLAGNEGSAASTFTVDAPVFAVQPETVYEGDAIGLYASDLPDVGDANGDQEGRTWQWSMARGADDPEPDTWAQGPVGYMVPDAAMDHVVELTVTDTATHAACVTSRTIHVLPQAPRAHALDVDVLLGGSADLVARFLDPGWTDVHTASWTVAGQSSDGTLTEDDVPAMESGFISGTIGVADGDAGVRGGTLRVTDSDLETPTTVPFKVNVIAPDPMRDEGNDGNATFDRATKLTSGQAHLSYIQSAGDIDIFEVRLPDGTPDGAELPYGTEVLVTLRDLPLDYDVAVIQDLGADAAADADMQDAAFQESSFASAPHLRSSWDPLPHLRSPHLRSPHLRSPFYSMSLEDAPHLRSPHLRSPYLGSPYIDTPHLRSPHLRSDIEDAPHLRSPFLMTPHLRSPHLRSPFDDMYYVQFGGTTDNALDGYSFADMSFTGQSDDQTSGTSITAEELGFNNEQMAGKRLRFSATPGTATEVVLVTTDFVGGKTYVAVKGANGAFSETEPYTLQVETSQPLDVLSYVNTPKDDPLVTDGATDRVQMKVEQPDQQPLTLFVTQAERLTALYGIDGRNTVLGALEAACADPRVEGEVMSLPSVDFDDWDVEPWKPETANALTDKIRSTIGQYLSAHDTVKYVVLVGSDEVVPQRRVQDETVLGNEREYVDAGAFLKYDSPLLASVWREMVLTDDFYVDAEPIAYNEHALYIPDIAVSRLVETPAEIAAQINVFLGRSPDGTQTLRDPGQLDGSTAIVTGQDFMTNGVERVQATLQAAGLSLPPVLLDTWKAEDVQSGLFEAPRDVGGLNAHFAHFGGISAYGYNQMPNDATDDPDARWDDTEFISGTDITGTQADPNEFVGKLIFSMGCHAGLNVPDDQSRTVAPDYGLEPSLDIPQAMARTGGVLVASTGYGFGDTVTVSGTEALIGLFAEQITATSGGGRQSIGLALAAAKRQYLGSLSTVTPYDEKSSIQFTMYGMPQYTLAAPARPTMLGASRSAATAAPSASLEQSTAPASGQAGGTFLHSFTVTIEEEGRPPRQVSADLVLNDAGASGEYVTADGDAQATADRPIQPRLVVDLGVNDGLFTAARVTAGSYVEREPFDPAISCWTTEWETYPVEFQVSAEGWWPADPVTLTTIETAGGYEQKLVILPGQFRATSAAGADTVTGVERLWSDLTVHLVRQPAGADPNDHLSPTASSVSLSKLGDTVTARVAASDASGISRIDVTNVGDGTRAYFPFPGVAPGPDGTYDVQFDLPGVAADELAVVVDVMDAAGNVTAVTAKGAVVTPVTDVTPPTTQVVAPGFDDNWHNSDVTISFTASDAGSGVMATQYAIDDGAWASGTSVTVTAPAGGGNDGPHTVHYRSIDNAGNEEPEQSGTVKIDTTVPLAVNSSTLTSSHKYASIWYPSRSPSFSWVPVPDYDGSGLAGYSYTFSQNAGDSPDSVADGADNFKVFNDVEDGTWYFRVRAVDRAGNAGPVTSYTGPVHIDGTAPPAVSLSSPTHPTESDWYTNDSPYFTWGAVNDTGGSGLQGYSYAFDQNETDPDLDALIECDAETTTSETFWDQADGIYYFHIRAVDNAGNAGAVSTYGVKIDRTPPQGSVVLNDGDSFTYASAARLDSQVTGAREIRTSTDHAGWTVWRDFTDVTLVTLPAGPGSKTVWAQFRDEAGNESEFSDSIDRELASLSAGGAHTAVIRADGSLWTWGNSQFGQMGYGPPTVAYEPTPLRLGADNDWTVVACGLAHTVALKSDGTLWAWGSNDFGELGDGTTAERDTPVQIGTDTDWAAIATCREHTLALKSDGSLWAWGWNQYGQLGDGTTIDQYSPVQVGEETDWTTIAAGEYLNAALKADGTLWTWGVDSGEGSTPTRVGSDADWAAIAAGGGHHLALKANGTLYAWGVNSNGGLGDGTTTDRWVPAQVGSDTDWVGISAGSFSSHAVKADGTTWAWGWNYYGQLGDGTTTDRYLPVEVGSGGDWALVEAGGFIGDMGQWSATTFGLGADGRLWAWGSNQEGQLGDGSTTDSHEPERVFDLANTAVPPTVTGPNGAESWVIGSSQTITWTPGSGGAVRIELSRDDGAHWETLYTGVSNDGSESWTVSGSASSQALVRVSNDAGLDISDADFQISLFATKVDFATGSGPRSVAVGDFNGDGKQDLATAYRTGDGVSVLLGTGSGTFAGRVDYATGSEPNSVAVGDFNRDGKQDLVTANLNGDNVSVLLGTGSGGFGAKTDYATSPGPRSVAVGDFNRDGRQDLATASNSGDCVSVLLGTGSGTFAGKVDYATGITGVSVAVGDFNGDGNQDLVTANLVGQSVSVLLGTGSGTFGGRVDYVTGSDPYSVAVGDFNGDGKQDLVTANMGGNNVSVLLGTGSGGFGAKTDYATGKGPYSVATGDFNGDGKQDVATANSSTDRSVSVLLGDGHGSLAVKTDCTTDSWPCSVTTGDFNGDGKQDLATANYLGNSVSILLNRPDLVVGALQLSAPATYTTSDAPVDVAMSDFNRDGVLDLVTVHEAVDTVGIRVGNGNGTFGGESVYSTGDNPGGVAVGDLNRDGKQDLVTVSTFDSKASVLLGNGNGSFQNKVDYSTGMVPRDVVLGDVNSDGALDVVTVNGYNTISVLLGNGNGTLQTKNDYPVVVNGSPNFLVLHDLNADGKLDIAVSNDQAKSITVLFNNGSGVFDTKTDYPAAESPRQVAVTDLNRDGRPDLVYAVDFNEDKVGVRFGNGDGTFQAEVVYPTGSSPYALAVGDVDRDGRQDVVTGNLHNTVSVLLGNSDGSLRDRQDVGGINWPGALAMGDVDCDGRVDIVAADYYSDTFSVMLNQTSP